jgi:hypothetical protein
VRRRPQEAAKIHLAIWEVAIEGREWRTRGPRTHADPRCERVATRVPSWRRCHDEKHLLLPPHGELTAPCGEGGRFEVIVNNQLMTSKGNPKPPIIPLFKPPLLKPPMLNITGGVHGCPAPKSSWRPS